MRSAAICFVFILLSISVNTRRSFHPLNPDSKLFLITLDGFRWEEVFNGADSTLISDPDATEDTSLSKALYWDSQPEERRKRLMPFFWNVIAKQGLLYGNRAYENKVDVSNPYALSYPGYNELLTGKVDYAISGNEKIRNTNRNILDLLSSSTAYSGKVAAFTSWDVFPYILGKEDDTSSGVILNSGLQEVEGKELTPSESMLNTLQDKVIREKPSTRYDELTFIACKEYIEKNRPSVVFLSFSGTDDAAHNARYDQYLQQANNADRMIGELWRTLQDMPEYKGRTTFLITTDHGRGNKKTNWANHGFFTSGSSQTWYALLGHTIVPNGEMKVKTQVYQKELNSLILEILSRR
jgi:hypothetical protein